MILLSGELIITVHVFIHLFKSDTCGSNRSVGDVVFLAYGFNDEDEMK